jgi:hypothetical protein
VFGGISGAQFPILDRVADKVIQKYQSSTCEQLAAEESAQAADVTGSDSETAQ